MQSYYEKLVIEKGIEAANAYMRALRLKRKRYPKKGGFNDPEIRKKAEETRGVVRGETHNPR